MFLDDFLLVNARYTAAELAVGRSRRGAGTSWSTATAARPGCSSSASSPCRSWPSAGRCAGTAARTPRTAALLGTGAGLLAALVWSIKDFNGWPDAFLLLPFAALGVGGLAGLLAELLPARAALAATLAWALVAAAMSLTYSVGARDHTLAEQRASVDTLRGLLPHDARIMSVGAPQPLVLAHERNLSRFQLFDNGLVDYLDDTWPGGKRGYGRWIVDDQRPTVIAIGHGVRRAGSRRTPGRLRPRRAGARLGLVRPPRRRRGHQEGPSDRARSPVLACGTMTGMTSPAK